MSEVTERREVLKSRTSILVPSSLPSTGELGLNSCLWNKTLVCGNIFLVGGGGLVRQFCWKIFTFQCTTKRLYKYMYMKGL